MLARYAQHFRAAELDTTYYAIPPAERVVGWREQTPEGFVLTAKIPKSVTQDARLEGPTAAAELERFLEVIRHLGSRLGPLVFQMSPSFTFPRHFRALRQMLQALSSLGGDELQFAVEFRHASWWQRGEPTALLTEHGVAWVWNDWTPTGSATAGVPRAIDDRAVLRATSDRFAYLRLVGDREVGDRFEEIDEARRGDLERWASLVRDFLGQHDDRAVYLMLNRHYAGPAPLVIRELERILGIDSHLPPSSSPSSGPPPTEPSAQPRLPGL